MQILCGIDIIEVDRIQESIESLGETFLNKVYIKLYHLLWCNGTAFLLTIHTKEDLNYDFSAK